MLRRIRNAASMGAYLARRLLLDPLIAPPRSQAFRRSLNAIRIAERQEASIPVRRLEDICSPRGQVMVDVGPHTEGNPALVELFCLGALVRASGARRIFEIGTFDGTTTLQLALNSPQDAVVWTLDLPREDIDLTRYPILYQDRTYIMKPKSGVRTVGTPVSQKIRQLYGDSATFDYRPYLGRMDLVVVDGSHALDYVRSDSANALVMIRPDGWIVWHDYGVWPDVTRGLHELSGTLPLARLEATSLVVGRSSAAPGSLTPADT